MATPYVVHSPPLGRSCANGQEFNNHDCFSKTLRQYCRDHDRHCVGENHMNCLLENGQCRYSYVPWCCVCDSRVRDGGGRPIYLGRRRCRSESTERDSGDNVNFYSHQLRMREDCDRSFRNYREYNLRSGTNYHERFRNKISRTDDVYEFFDAASVPNKQIFSGYPCFNLVKNSSPQHSSTRTSTCRQLLGSCENRTELVDRNIYFSKKCANENKCTLGVWSKVERTARLNGHHDFMQKGNDRYMQEVEMLRSKLRDLKEGTQDGKRLRRLSESECGLPGGNDGGTKRARDNSPHIKPSHISTVLDLPIINPAMLAPRSPSPNNLASEEGSSISSDSECVDSASDDDDVDDDEEEIREEPEVEIEESIKQVHVLSSSVSSASASNSSSPSHVVGDGLGSISLCDQPVNCVFPLPLSEHASSVSNSVSKDDHQASKGVFVLPGPSGTSDALVGTHILSKLQIENEPSKLTRSLECVTVDGSGDCAVCEMHPGLRASLFSHVPPFIHFSDHLNTVLEFPQQVQTLLKWKMSKITPVIVRRTVINSGFKLVRKSNEWCGTWGKHMKSVCFKTLRDFQKMNHFPGTFQIGRKDNLWKNLLRLMTKFGKKEFGFMPRTYILPQDNKLLRSAWEKRCGRQRWIVKPPASARGAGIKVIHKWTQIPKKCPLIVQKYISYPYLINGSKFDLRLYALVTSINPLRVYLYDNGLVRFASVKYSSDLTTLVDRYMHLTNYSINKLSSMYTSNEDAGACQGHKWTLKALWAYLQKEKGVNVGKLWANMVDLVIKTMISGESSITELSKAHLASRYCSYELFGIDILLDEGLKPWLLEVNISPSLHSSTPLDSAVKGPMVKDIMNIAGYHIPNKLTTAQQETLYGKLGVGSNFCFDKRLYTTQLSPAERTKHCDYQLIETREEYLNSILENLMPDDVRHLIQYEDELSQKGNFQKIFPTEKTYHYMQFFEQPRYYNMLFDAWETQFHDNRRKGIQLLEDLCLKQVHLQVFAQAKGTKASMNRTTLPQQQEQTQESGEVIMEEGEEQHSPTVDEEEIEEDLSQKADKQRERQWTLSATALCRAARSRSGKPGLVIKPFPHSSFIACLPQSIQAHKMKTSVKVKS